MRASSSSGGGGGGGGGGKLLLLPVAGLLLCLLALAIGKALAESEQAKLPKLFDFAHFKRLFNKRYQSTWEELARKRQFMSRALRAYVSAVNYKFRRSSHFNAVNHMSDLNRQELEQMRNKLMEREDQFGATASSRLQLGESGVSAEAELPELVPGEEEDVERELLEVLAEHGNEAEFAPLRQEMKFKSQRRRKREIGPDARVGAGNLRELPLSRLINTGQVDDERAAAALESAQKPILRNPRSNNPDYEPFDSATFGLSDQEEPVKWWSVDRRSMKPVSEQLVESLEEREARMGPLERSALPDELFFDHRSEGCLMEPRQQGLCSACYAFALTTLMEWLLCKKSGKLVPLSEQYMIDCAKGRFNKTMAGCDGGSVYGGAQFVHNFGLELQKNYPYFSREGQCPYEEHFDLKRTGFIRMELGDAVNVHADLWERIIKHSPIYIKARTGDDFLEYAGGVYQGQGCLDKTNHAMVLVGHGRQDGQQYWLLRNSMGINWGQRGYWKLAKAAAARCLDLNGVAFGTKTGIKYDVKPRNSKPKVKKA